jgi:hypothetical protein
MTDYEEQDPLEEFTETSHISKQMTRRQMPVSGAYYTDYCGNQQKVPTYLVQVLAIWDKLNKGNKVALAKFADELLHSQMEATRARKRAAKKKTDVEVPRPKKETTKKVQKSKPVPIAPVLPTTDTPKKPFKPPQPKKRLPESAPEGIPSPKKVRPSLSKSISDAKAVYEQLQKEEKIALQEARRTVGPSQHIGRHELLQNCDDRVKAITAAKTTSCHPRPGLLGHPASAKSPSKVVKLYDDSIVDRLATHSSYDEATTDSDLHCNEEVEKEEDIDADLLKDIQTLETQSMK